MLEGTKSIFGPEPLSDDIIARCAAMDIHPTGPMWGTGTLRSRDEVQLLESRLSAESPELCRGLEKAELHQERRALRLIPKNLSWRFEADDVLELHFELPPGAYATSDLAELGDFS